MDLEQEFAMQLNAAQIPFERQYRPTKRRHRWDFAVPAAHVLIDLQGGIWLKKGSASNHASPRGVQNDCVKLNYATLAGWRVLKFTAREVKDGSGLKWLEALIERTKGSKCPDSTMKPV
jgi:very-short-patch-repair endonuclease